MENGIIAGIQTRMNAPIREKPLFKQLTVSRECLSVQHLCFLTLSLPGIIRNVKSARQSKSLTGSDSWLKGAQPTFATSV
jgi:hypothetical protein